MRVSRNSARSIGEDLALFLLTLILSCYGGAPPPIPLDPVRFLSINDVQLPDTLPNGLGGLARVATVRQRLADQGPILFVLAGNALGSDAKRMVDLLNRAHLDFATFGEHELNLGPDALAIWWPNLSSPGFQQLYPAGRNPFPRWFPGTRFGSRATRWVCSGSLFRVRIPTASGAPIPTARLTGPLRCWAPTPRT